MHLPWELEAKFGSHGRIRGGSRKLCVETSRASTSQQDELKRVLRLTRLENFLLRTASEAYVHLLPYTTKQAYSRRRLANVKLDTGYSCL